MSMGDASILTDLNVERTILGAILVNNEQYAAAAALLNAGDFTGTHRAIYSGITQMIESCGAVDVVTLESHLQTTGKLNEAGGTAYIYDLTDLIPMSGLDTSYYAGIIKEKSSGRALVRAFEGGIAQLLDGEKPTQVLSTFDEAALNMRAASSGRISKLIEFAGEAWRDLEAQIEHKGAADYLGGLSTGIEAIDRFTGGIRRGEMWCLGGRPGEGKSCIATQVLAANAKRGIPVALFTPEMTREQVLNRIACQHSGIASWMFRKPWKMGNPERAQLEEVYAEIRQWPIVIDDSSSITADEINARARLLEKREGVRLTVVDYVQLIDCKGNDERAKVTGVSKRMRALAKESMPVLVLSQMPRPSDRNLNRWPTKYDLKESGALENDSATVLMIFRKVDSETNLPVGEDWIVVPKQRNGAVGAEQVVFDSNSLLYKPRMATGTPHSPSNRETA